MSFLLSWFNKTIRMKYFSISIIALILVMCGDSTSKERSFSKETFTSKTSYELPYRLLKPDQEKAGETYPLVIFLHGSGERGNDNEKQLVHIAPSFLTDDYMNTYPSYVIFPQCPEGDYWGTVNVINDQWYVGESSEPSSAGQAVLDLIDDFIRKNPVDRRKIYIAGLSMGGFGTLDLIRHRTEFFAGAIAICGGGNKRYVNEYRDLPVWLFHGAKDPVVPVTLSREMSTEYKIRNMDYRYTEYPEGGHDVWNKAWSESDLLPWLFSKNRKTKS